MQWGTLVKRERYYFYVFMSGDLTGLCLYMSAWSSCMRCNIVNHCDDCRLVKLKGALIGVVYFSMEKVLLFWSLDQYNNVH